MLNAAKSMLSANKIDFKSYHGLSGKSNGSKTSLANEVSEIKNEGILISLAEYYKLNLHKDSKSWLPRLGTEAIQSISAILEISD